MLQQKNQTLDCPFLELGTDFPDTLYILKHPPSGKYGCYRYQGCRGLAVFSSEASAFRFAEWIDLSGMVVLTVSFDEAREIAKARPRPITSMMLLDDLQHPQIHHVR